MVPRGDDLLYAPCHSKLSMQVRRRLLLSPPRGNLPSFHVCHDTHLEASTTLPLHVLPLHHHPEPSTNLQHNAPFSTQKNLYGNNNNNKNNARTYESLIRLRIPYFGKRISDCVGLATRTNMGNIFGVAGLENWSHDVWRHVEVSSSSENVDLRFHHHHHH